MTSVANLKLSWGGPLRVGSLPEGNDQDHLSGPHVYLFIGRFTESNVVYVGQSKNFLARLWQHYRDYLGLHYFIRGSDMEQVYDPSTDYMFGALNAIDEIYPNVIEELRRLNIFYASCEEALLNPAEAALIDHVRDQSRRTKGWICDNGRRQNYGGYSGCHVEMKWPDTDTYSQLRIGDLFPDSSVFVEMN